MKKLDIFIDKIIGNKFFPFWTALAAFTASNVLALLCILFMKTNIILAISFIISSIILWGVGFVAAVAILVNINNYYNNKIEELKSRKYNA